MCLNYLCTFFRNILTSRGRDPGALSFSWLHCSSAQASSNSEQLFNQILSVRFFCWEYLLRFHLNDFFDDFLFRVEWSHSENNKAEDKNYKEWSCEGLGSII